MCMRSGRLSACASMLSACVTRGAEMAGALEWRGDGPNISLPYTRRLCCECDREKKPRFLAGPRFHAPSASVGHACAPHAHRELIVLVRLPLEGRVSRRHTASLDAVVGAAWQPAKQPSSQMRGAVTRGRYHSVTFVAARPCCRRSFDVASPSRCFLRACRRSSTA
jgi:hypothetical protein